MKLKLSYIIREIWSRTILNDNIFGSGRDYRADSQSVGYDSEFDIHLKIVFTKRQAREKKDELKELLEEYLEKRKAQEFLDKKIQKEYDIRKTLRKSDAGKAYNN